MNVLIGILILFGVVVVLVVVSVLMYRALVAVFGSMYRVYDYFQERRWQRRERRRLHEEFLEAFGFEFFSGLLDTTHVDIRLGILAIDFHDACEAQGMLGSVKVVPTPTLGSSWGFVCRLVDERIEATKKEFWHAHKLAEKLGFEVRESHADYLPAYPTGAAMLAYLRGA